MTLAYRPGAVVAYTQAQKIIRSQNATHKDLEEGIEYLNAAISMRPTNGRYYFARWVTSWTGCMVAYLLSHAPAALAHDCWRRSSANCLRSMGEYQRAFFDYSAAIRLDENHGLYYCNRGICLRKVGGASARELAARQHLTRGVAYACAGVAQLNRLREGLADLCKAVELDPANVSHRLLASGCVAQAGTSDTRRVRGCVRVATRQGSFYFNRGLVLFDMEEYEAAIKDFSSTIQSNRSMFRAYFNRGNCFRKLGRLGTERRLRAGELRVTCDVRALTTVPCCAQTRRLRTWKRRCKRMPGLPAGTTTWGLRCARQGGTKTRYAASTWPWSGNRRTPPS